MKINISQLYKESNLYLNYKLSRVDQANYSGVERFNNIRYIGAEQKEANPAFIVDKNTKRIVLVNHSDDLSCCTR